MKTFQINEKSFKLESDVHKFLSDYLQRVETFVRKNTIESDLHQDILQRLGDKLSEKEKSGITQKVAIHIVNDLGEPEEIFGEETAFDFSEKEKKSATTPQSNSKFYEKCQATQRSRPQEGAIFLGVCKMFEQLTDWNVRIWRGGALFASWGFLTSGMGSAFIFGWFMYFLLALIFPRKEKNYHQKSVFNYFLTQIWDLRLMVINSLSRFFSFCKWILGVVFPTCSKRLSKLFGPLWKGIKTLFLIGRSGFLLFVIIGLGTGWYFLVAGFVKNNVDFATAFPTFTKWGVLLGIISAFLLFLHSVGAVSKKKFSNNRSLIIAIGSGIFAISIAMISGMTMVTNYVGKEEIKLQKEVTIPLSELEQPLIIDIETTEGRYFSHGFGIGEPIRQERFINFIPYTGNEIKAVYTYKLYASMQNEVRNTVIENLADPIYTIKDGNLNIFLSGHQVVDQLSPFVMGSFDIMLYIPTDLKFKVIANGSEHYRLFPNLSRPERAKKIGYSGNGECSDWITYDKKENNFFCPMKFKLSDGQIRGAIEEEIREKADQLSPLEGLNRDWSHNYGDRLYRSLHSILWKDQNRMVVKLSDQFFNLFLELEIKLDEAGDISIVKNSLKELEQKGNMTPARMNLYTGWETLKNFEIKKQEEPEKGENYVTKKEFDALLETLKHRGMLNSGGENLELRSGA